MKGDWQLKREHSKLYGFKIGEYHTKDFGLMCVDVSVGFPNKNKTLIDVPFGNSVIDLSYLYQGQTFSERTIEFEFFFPKYDVFNSDELYRLWTKVVNWLSGQVGKRPLYDDRMQRYYYLAEMVDAPDYEHLVTEGKLTIKFDAYPFRIYNLKEGNDLWNLFDFELDLAQQVTHTIEGNKTFDLYNIGTNVAVPTVTTSNSFRITYRDQVISVPAGRTTISRIRLLTGRNQFRVEGNGTIDFLWHKELI